MRTPNGSCENSAGLLDAPSTCSPPKDTRDEKGAARWRCPATGPYPDLSCSLRPTKPGNGGKRTGLGMPAFRPTTPVLTPPTMPERICTNTSGTSFPATAGAKYAQKLQYKTKAWQKLYSHARDDLRTYTPAPAAPPPDTPQAA